MWIFAIFILLIYSPLTWVRTIEWFSKAFVFSMAMILLAVVTTSVYCINLIKEDGGEPGPNYVPINMDGYFIMLGFAFFMFEGIGCLLPVMRETKEPENFGKLTVACLATLCTVYIAFSSLCLSLIHI